MINRTETEKREYSLLSEMATKSADSRGREQEEEKCDIRTDFQRDRDRIMHCKAFRRLMHKTQVFLSPEGDHFRTRLTHTLEVSQVARTIARGLALNEDLTEAIALGHDLGHTPFGHNGEQFLSECHPGGFRHNEQSMRVVDKLETRTPGSTVRGLNLTQEVRDGILNHTGPDKPFTPEGQVVRISDRIAYINHDIDDAVRAGIITEDSLPRDCVKLLGNNYRKRIDTLVTDVVIFSEKEGKIVQGDDCAFFMDKLRNYMFENVYRNSEVKKTDEMKKIKHLIFSLYDYFMKNPQSMPNEHIEMLYLYGTDEVVKDYIAGMTDRYAMKMYNNVFVPTGWKL